VVPDNQNDNCANRRTYKARALIRSIPADALTDPGSNEPTGDTKRGREDEPARVIRPRQEKSRDETSDEADQNDPNKG
jgi:hypothetical protein